MTVLAADIIERAILHNYAFSARNPLLLVDSTYATVNDADAQGYFSAVARVAQQQLGEWVENVIDCDKYARLVATLAMVGHAQEPAAVKKKTGLAVGVFAYVSDTLGPHAINFMVTKVTGQTHLRVRFFEPQTGEELQLSNSEKAGILWAIL